MVLAILFFTFSVILRSSVYPLYYSLNLNFHFLLTHVPRASTLKLLLEKRLGLLLRYQFALIFPSEMYIKNIVISKGMPL